jgi:hypothetical protein
MKRTMLGVLGLVVLILSLGAIPLLAQGKWVFDVSFEFSVGGAKLPAGRYELGISRQSLDIITVANLDTGKSIAVNYLTRLGPRNIEKPELVFDKDGDQAYLSEIHIPNIDGFHLQGAPGKHSHVSIIGTK